MPDDHIKRCDVRVPIDLYNQIEKIAVEEYNAPTYRLLSQRRVDPEINLPASNSPPLRSQIKTSRKRSRRKAILIE